MEASRATGGSVDADVQKAMLMGIAATERKDYKSAITLFNHLYGNPSFDAPVEGLSYYGLCVAVEEKQTKRGIELCREAMKQQFYDARHHANLVRLHIAKKNRRLACQALESALAKLPGDRILTQLREEIGYRQRNPVPFLPRNAWINEWMGKKRRGQGNQPSSTNTPRGGVAALDFTNLEPAYMMLIGFLGFVAIFGITFYVLYQQAYG